MGRDWTFGRKIGVGFAAAGLIMLLLAGVGFRSSHHLIENDRLVAHTHQVRLALADLLVPLVDAETGGRGFALTGDEKFLEPYADALPRVGAKLDELRQLTGDNPDQQRRLTELRPWIDKKLAFLADLVDTRRGPTGFDGALKLVVGGTGRGYMNDIRRIVTEMDREEEALLARRRIAAEDTAGTTKAVMLGGGIIGIALILGIGFVLSRSLSKQIAAAVHHVQSSSAELQSAANQQVTGAKEQATAMNEITTTISELLATSRQIAESAERVAQIAGQTAAAARSGDVTVAKGSESIAGIRRQVEGIVNHMLDLGKKSQQIGAVLDIVSELAEQTNILAINATIEAAGAGEAGKRFAVVADEIRKLADRVGGSTKEIRGLIDDVRSAVNTTVMTTETGSKTVETGQRQFIDVADAFRQIAGLVTTTTEAAKEIELSTKQQATAVEQVNVAITSVAQTTKETEVSSGQTLQTASQLTVLSRDLLRIVQPQAPA